MKGLALLLPVLVAFQVGVQPRSPGPGPSAGRCFDPSSWVTTRTQAGSTAGSTSAPPRAQTCARPLRARSASPASSPRAERRSRSAPATATRSRCSISATTPSRAGRRSPKKTWSARLVRAGIRPRRSRTSISVSAWPTTRMATSTRSDFCRPPPSRWKTRRRPSPQAPPLRRRPRGWKATPRRRRRIRRPLRRIRSTRSPPAPRRRPRAFMRPRTARPEARVREPPLTFNARVSRPPRSGLPLSHGLMRRRQERRSRKGMTVRLAKRATRAEAGYRGPGRLPPRPGPARSVWLLG